MLCKMKEILDDAQKKVMVRPILTQLITIWCVRTLKQLRLYVRL